MRCPKPAALALVGLALGTGLAGCGHKATPPAEPEPVVKAAPAPKGTPTAAAPTQPVPTPAPAPEVATAEGALPVAPPPLALLAPTATAPDTIQPLTVNPLAVPFQPVAAQPVAAQPPAPADTQLTTQPPAPKDAPKEPQWPKEVNGKPLSEFVKDAADPDPAKREFALRTLPQFGPAAQKAAGKVILARIDSEYEKDPGVRAGAFEAAGALGFDNELDTRKAVQLLAGAVSGGAGGGTRLHAIQTLAAFGPKADSAVPNVKAAATDPAYETRRAAASTLGMIAFDEIMGPSHQALDTLTQTLIKDRSAAVRLAAYQSVILLGPTYLPRNKGDLPLKDIKPPMPIPKVDTAAVAKYLAAIKRQLAPFKPSGPDKSSLTGLVERDPQVEIMARLALIRLDPKELTDENVNAIVKYLGQSETGPKLQALNALGLIGPAVTKRFDEVARALSDENPAVVGAAVAALVSMGTDQAPRTIAAVEKLLTSENLQVVAAGVNGLLALGPAARPAIPAIERLKDRGKTKEEKEAWAKLSAEAVKTIMEAKVPEKK